MTSIFALGLNHHTAPLAVRSRVAFPQSSVAEALRHLTLHTRVTEAALVSTCNRTEFILSAPEPDEAVAWFMRYRSLNPSEISPYLFALPNDEAVRHVFRVAAGLDSMVVGEPQILGQMKDAARAAQAAGTLGITLNRLMQSAFSVAKSVRSDTAIGSNIVSMAAASVHLAERIFERLSDTQVLFVGAGEMVSLCAAHFGSVNPRLMTVANRSAERAEALAQPIGGRSMPLEAIADHLHEYDVVIACTDSPLPIIGRGMVERAMRARRHRPMVMVDLAVPRDIEPEAAAVSDVFLYSVDDLAQIVSTGMESRQEAVAQAEQIVSAGVDAFSQWLTRRDLVPTIRALREEVDALRAAELARALRALARGEAPEAVLDALSKALINKILHGPTQYLSVAREQGEAQAAHDTVRAIFRLHDNRLNDDNPDSDA